MAKTLSNYIDYVRNLLDQIVKDAKNFEATAAPKRRETYIGCRIKELESNYSEAKTLHLKIIATKEEGTLKQTYFEDEVFLKLKEAFLEYHGELNEALLEETKGLNTTTAQEKTVDIKLRRIEIPPFSGGYDQWRPFYELYVSLVHSNDSLADIQKLHYLKASVQGEAARLLQHISLEEKNYASAWTILTDRYENKRVLVNTHLRILLSQRPLSTETAVGIKTILDTTTECMHSLRNLGVPVDTWDVMLIYSLCAKLPTSTQELWEEQLQGAKNLVEFTTFAKFLETRFRTLESIEQSKSELRRTLKTPPSYPFKQTKNFHAGIAKEYQPSCPLQSIVCQLCKKDHSLRQCEQFRNMDGQTRLNTVRKLSACTNCLSFRHTRKQCTSRYTCQECKQNHHTLLHLKPQQKIQQRYNTRSSNTSYKQINAQHLSVNEQTQQSTSQNSQRQTTTTLPPIQNYTQEQDGGRLSGHYNQIVQTFFTQQVKPTKTLLATALINCQGANGESFTFRALIDPGSEATFITEAAVQKLRLPKRKTLTNIISLGQLTTGTAHGKTTLTISSTHNTKFNITIEAYVYNNITSILPAEKFEIQNWRHLEGLQLADPIFNVPGKIDLLLGADVYAIIILAGLRKGPPGAPIAQNSELGWIISGNISGPINKTIHTYHQTIDLDAQLRRFWEIEEVPERRKLTEEEKKCEDHYIQTHKRLQDGRYQVRLPFKNNTRPLFQDSRQSALSRLFHLERRFQVNPKLRDMYAECFNDYISSSHMTEVRPPKNEESYYLPHHAVFKESSTTKLRVVFDASCKAKNGQSLNNNLMIGPTLQNELSSIIIKWRRFKVAFTADITKMYRQIWVDPQDSSYQLICWRDKTDSNIKTYALNTVTFGTASAPFLAVRTLQQLAADEQKAYPLASKILKENFYVDDVMYGADSTAEALESQKQLISVTNSAGFPLRKWASNVEAILKVIPQSDREIDIPLTFGTENYVKTLGFQWYPKEDIFRFNFKLPKLANITKRSILSDISRLFDPHGWISPCVVYAKLIIQELWLQQANWDDTIPERLQTQWVKYRNELHTLEDVKIPRWVNTSSTSEKIQLHGFCDASEKAYAAAIYIRVKHKGKIHVQLLTAKTKITPLKRISLPRLELCAAVLLAKLIEFVKQAMDLQNIETVAWTDSMITLSWIKSNPSKWKSFIANRVTEIQSRTPANMWRHVGSKDNPADIASRGLFPSEINQAITWWQGPSFLKESTIKYVSNAVTINTELEIRKIKSMCLGMSRSIFLEIIERFSTLNRAIRVLAYCLRASQNFRQSKERTKGPLTVREIEKGIQSAIKATQTEAFNQEKFNLLNGTKINKNSKILNLHPFLDSNEILRVGGRLQNAQLPFSRQHPIIIPHGSHLTTLLIRDAHLTVEHGGITSTTEHVQNRYWIVNAKRNIKTIINKCITCFRFKALQTSQLMGNLPSARVQIARPFCNTGIDYAGPLDIKAWKGRCNKFYKGYIAIFVCLCTKAIHIELVSVLSTTAFIAAYRRFTSGRGICQNLYSDNGTNFVGANNKMTADMRIIKKQWEIDIADKLSSLGTQWHFNSPAAPHFGGLWEAGVKSIKHHLKRITGNAKLTFEEYATLLSQIEACLNSRPLCPKSPDPDDLSTLTPGHFLIMAPLNTPPEQDLQNMKISTLDRWKYIQHLYQNFWNKWSTEYLARLQQRPKWNYPQPNIKVGNLVLIKDARMPPTHWQLARVTATHPGEDSLTRVVTLKTATNTFQRPINKVCLLPIADNDNKEEEAVKRIISSN